MPEQAEKLARLTDDLIRRVEGSPLGWPKRTSFARFFRAREGRGSIEHLWPRLRKGEPVPAAVVAGFVDYLRERHGWPELMPEAACVAARPEADDVLSDFGTMINGLTERFVADDAMYLQHPRDDPAFAAAAIMAGVGRQAPGARDGGHLELGSRIMGFAPGDYADWLAAFWEASSRTVMFAACRTPGGHRRVGVNVMLPLRDRAFERLTGGAMREADLTPADLENPSQLLYAHSLCEIPGDLPYRQATTAQARCLMYQAAYFTRGLKLSRIRVATLVANPTNERRLRRHGYRRNGRTLLGTDKPIAVLSRPRVSDEHFAATLVPFEIATTILRLYRRVNRRAWLDEDGPK